MYGMLQGCNKSKLVMQHGDDQVNIWRREYTGTPPPLNQNLKQHPVNESKYAVSYLYLLDDKITCKVTFRWRQY